ncbi:hypothetical protein PUN28_002189 [Cardiocondyla obscurior]|uniref:Uncharacterized protein n=1 Tax=Cardiocondyla obscurior TaxID=286306 RepID=A0AAW2GSU6_9HYME
MSSVLGDAFVMRQENRIENHIFVEYPAIGRIYVDGEPMHNVEIKNLVRLLIPHTQPINPYDIKIRGFINIQQILEQRRARQNDREYNNYVWMNQHIGDDFGLQTLFNMEYDKFFEPESWD